MNKTNRKSQTKSNTYNSDFNADTPLWSESGISKEEDIGMCKGRRISNVENTKEEVKGNTW